MIRVRRQRQPHKDPLLLCAVKIHAVGELVRSPQFYRLYPPAGLCATLIPVAKSGVAVALSLAPPLDLPFLSGFSLQCLESNQE